MWQSKRMDQTIIIDFKSILLTSYCKLQDDAVGYTFVNLLKPLMNPV